MPSIATDYFFHLSSPIDPHERELAHFLADHRINQHNVDPAILDDISRKGFVYLKRLEELQYSRIVTLKNRFDRLMRSLRYGVNQQELKKWVNELRRVELTKHVVAHRAMMTGALLLTEPQEEEIGAPDFIIPVDQNRFIPFNWQQMGDDVYLHPLKGLGVCTGKTLVQDKEEMWELSFSGVESYVKANELLPVKEPKAMEALINLTDSQYPRLLSLAAFILKNMYDGIPQQYGFYHSSIHATWMNAFKMHQRERDVVHGEQTNPNLVLTEQGLNRAALDLGIDPIVFALSLCHGVSLEVLINQTLTFANGRLDRIFKPDLMLAFLLQRPWEKHWEPRSPDVIPRVLTAGYVLDDNAFPKGVKREHDLLALYKAFKSGDDMAIHQAQKRLLPGVKLWKERLPVTLVPISSSAETSGPTVKLASQLASRTGLDMHNPWVRKNLNTSAVDHGLMYNRKMILDRGLQLDPDKAGSLKDKPVLLIGDGIFTGCTHMRAHALLRDVGVTEIGSLNLVQGITHSALMNQVFGPQLLLM